MIDHASWFLATSIFVSPWISGSPSLPLAPGPVTGPLGLGFLLGGIGVALSAFGAHALEGRISEASLSIFDTAARYHMLHAIVLLLVALVDARWPDPSWKWVGGLMFGGTLVFSGTLYLLAVSGIGWLGAITPVGGTMLIAGWLWGARIAFRI